MKLRYQNIFWKVFQSGLGFALIVIQSKYIFGNELATLVIAQAMLVVVSLFDFGSGVRFTTSLVETFNAYPYSRETRKAIGQHLLYSRRLEIYRIGLIQSLIFGLSFLFLNFNLTSKVDLGLCLLFSLSVLFHSVGNNFGKLYIATGQIDLLVKLQSIGAIIGFCGGVIGLKTNFSVQMSIVALSFSSIFIGFVSMLPTRRISEQDNIYVKNFLANSLKDTLNKLELNLQLSQFFQFLQPLIVQHFVIENFKSTGVVAYLICQRLFGALGNALSSETQLNYTYTQVSNRYTIDDVMRFKRHLLGFILLSMLTVLALTSLWPVIFPSIFSLSPIDLLSFIPLGLCIFVDQAAKIRLYVLKLFFREMFTNLTYLVSICLLFLAFPAPTPLIFNSLLVISYVFKLYATTNIWEKFGK